MDSIDAPGLRPCPEANHVISPQLQDIREIKNRISLFLMIQIALLSVALAVFILSKDRTFLLKPAIYCVVRELRFVVIL